jgi:hypothetical protein
MFVTHQGQKELEVVDGESWDAYNFGKLAEKMTYLIEKNILDPSLREWVMPNFTTTTETDKVVASIIMMGALQKYFSYKFIIRCGLPSVTLLGDKADWESILTKIERIPQFGPEPGQWYGLLKPVVTRFVRTFDSPDAPETKDFWQKIAHYSGGGSGPTYLSGWITAFCFWDKVGRSLFPAEGIAPDDLVMRGGTTPHLVLDDAVYYRIDSTDIPPGFASVPVKVDDNGHEYDTIMVAGSVGIKVTSSGELLTPMRRWRYGGQTRLEEEPTVGLDTVQPESGWWIFEKKKEENEQEKAHSGWWERPQLDTDLDLMT